MRAMALVCAGLAAVLAGCADLTYDATAPTVTIVYPVSWSTFARDTIEIRADAYDNVELDRVVFHVDGESAGSVQDKPYHLRWYPDTTGGHSIHCVAYDAAGNEAHSSPVVVTIISGELPPDLEPPYVALVRPASWSVVQDTVRVEAIAGDNRGVRRVVFFLDGDTLAVMGGLPWIHYWDSRSVGDGYHTIYAAAADSSGNLGYSAVLTVDVRNAR
ncbi:MAG: Ig-like domain-containing protein [candidate division WOR-3 bacterium]